MAGQLILLLDLLPALVFVRRPGFLDFFLPVPGRALSSGPLMFRGFSVPALLGASAAASVAFVVFRRAWPGGIDDRPRIAGASPLRSRSNPRGPGRARGGRRRHARSAPVRGRPADGVGLIGARPRYGFRARGSNSRRAGWKRGSSRRPAARISRQKSPKSWTPTMIA